MAESCSALRKRRSILPSQRGRLFDNAPSRRRKDFGNDSDDDDVENEIEESETDEEEDEDFLDNVDNTE